MVHFNNIYMTLSKSVLKLKGYRVKRNLNDMNDNIKNNNNNNNNIMIMTIIKIIICVVSRLVDIKRARNFIVL